MTGLTAQQLRSWVGLLGESNDVRVIKILNTRDSLARGLGESDEIIETTVDRLFRVLTPLV